MGRGSGHETGSGPSGILRGDSLNPESVYAKPVSRQPDPEHEGVSIDTYRYQGQTCELRSGALPFDLETGRIFEDHEVFTPSGAWIGADRPVPHRRMTNGALTELGPEVVGQLFERYENGDFGDPEDGGEIGFAFYRVNGHAVYLVDEATRSLEGEPPLRDPKTSPGPQTVLLSSEY